MNNGESGSQDKLNVVSTAKGSAFFVDLDEVIKNEKAQCKKKSLEKKVSAGTALYIPFEKKKKKRHKSVDDSFSSDSSTLNRTFNKEDFEKLKAEQKCRDKLEMTPQQLQLNCKPPTPPQHPRPLKAALTASPQTSSCNRYLFQQPNSPQLSPNSKSKPLTPLLKIERRGVMYRKMMEAQKHAKGIVEEYDTMGDIEHIDENPERDFSAQIESQAMSCNDVNTNFTSILPVKMASILSVQELNEEHANKMSSDFTKSSLTQPTSPTKHEPQIEQLYENSNSSVLFPPLACSVPSLTRVQSSDSLIRQRSSDSIQKKTSTTTIKKKASSAKVRSHNSLQNTKTCASEPMSKTSKTSSKTTPQKRPLKAKKAAGKKKGKKKPAPEKTATPPSSEGTISTHSSPRVDNDRKCIEKITDETYNNIKQVDESTLINVPLGSDNKVVPVEIKTGESQNQNEAKESTKSPGKASPIVGTFPLDDRLCFSPRLGTNDSPVMKQIDSEKTITNEDNSLQHDIEPTGDEDLFSFYIDKSQLGSHSDIKGGKREDACDANSQRIPNWAITAGVDLAPFPKPLQSLSSESSMDEDACENEDIDFATALNSISQSMEVSSIDSDIVPFPVHSKQGESNNLFSPSNRRYVQNLSKISEQTEATDKGSMYSSIASSQQVKNTGNVSGNESFQEMANFIFQPSVVEQYAVTPSPRVKERSMSDASEDAQYIRSFLGNVSGMSLYSTASSGSSAKEADVVEWQKGKIVDRGASGTVYQGLTNKAQLIAVKEVIIKDGKSAIKVRTVYFFTTKTVLHFCVSE